VCHQLRVGNLAASGGDTEESMREPPHTSALDEDLNAQQREAATWGDGPLLVFAGAGSGKTRVIAARIVHLIRDRGIPPARILGLTFTNKAAVEMKERVAAHLPPSTRGPFLGTFHSFCARVLRVHGRAVGLAPDFTILDERDQMALIKDLVRSMEIDAARFAPRALRTLIERAKRQGGMRQVLEGTTSEDRIETIVKIHQTYEKRLRGQNALDFGDLILGTVELLESGTEEARRLSLRYDHVLVDEFQDTDRMQARLLTLLAPPPDGSICVVGDDDQSIYRWRGADVRNILEFRDSYPSAHIVKLERNYRSTRTILETALAVIRCNTRRVDKTLWTEGEGGAPIVRYDAASEKDEAHFVAGRLAALAEAGVPLSEQAVLYRVHAQSRAIEEALGERGLPYRIVGGVRFYDRAEIRDMLAFARLALNPDDDVALSRVINRPARGLGDRTLAILRDRARAEGVSLARAARDVSRGGPITRNARESLASFLLDVRRWHEASAEARPSALLESIIEDTGYVDALEARNDPESAARIMNVRELQAVVREFELDEPEGTLRSLLTRIALSSSADEVPGEDDRAVLMTVHAAKGLEFDSVIVAGLEDELFPLPDFDDDTNVARARERLDEERRLFYVAVTRARRHLALTWSRSRRIFHGQSRYRSPSPFLEAVPSRLVAAVPSRTAPPAPCPEVERSGPGRRVRHKKFGVGVVVGVEEGIHRKVLVRFPDGRIRKIIESFLEPT
jgi:DNA helicase-2/ATP-dependent DNA helicase PcrA